MVTYRAAATIEDWVMGLRLVYQTYRRAGLIPPNRYQLLATPYHLLPTTDLFVAADSTRLLLTMTLVRDGLLGLPADTIFREMVAKHRTQQGILGELTCLGMETDLKDLRHFIQLLRLVVQYVRRTERVTELFMSVHPRQVPFYQRVLGFQPLAEVPQQPAAKTPLVLLLLDLVNLQTVHPRGYQLLLANPLPAESIWPTRLPLDQRRLLEPFTDKSLLPMPLLFCEEPDEESPEPQLASEDSKV